MITTEFYDGAGCGNQLWTYCVTRAIAQTRKLKYGIGKPEKFKGKDFLQLDFGLPVIGGETTPGNDWLAISLPEGIENHYCEKLVRNSDGIDVTPYDINLVRVEDNTKIDGNMQSVYYLIHLKSEVIKWIKIKEEYLNYENGRYIDDNVCLIHIRGGDYSGGPAKSLLPKSYYQNAMKIMLNFNSKIKFYIVTDDYNLSKHYFGNEINIIGSTPSGVPDPNKASHHIGGNIGVDYGILYQAKNVIMANSTFSWWAVWSGNTANRVICPYRWLAFNCPEEPTKYWSTNDMRTGGWQYIDRSGLLV